MLIYVDINWDEEMLWFLKSIPLKFNIILLSTNSLLPQIHIDLVKRGIFRDWIFRAQDGQLEK